MSHPYSHPNQLTCVLCLRQSQRVQVLSLSTPSHYPPPRGGAQAFTPPAPHHHQTVLQDVSWQGPQDLFLKSQVMPEPIPDSLNHEGGRVSLVLHQLLPSPRDSDAP